MYFSRDANPKKSWYFGALAGGYKHGERASAAISMGLSLSSSVWEGPGPTRIRWPPLGRSKAWQGHTVRCNRRWCREQRGYGLTSGKQLGVYFSGGIFVARQPPKVEV